MKKKQKDKQKLKDGNFNFILIYFMFILNIFFKFRQQTKSFNDSGCTEKFVVCDWNTATFYSGRTAERIFEIWKNR